MKNPKNPCSQHPSRRQVSRCGNRRFGGLAHDPRLPIRGCTAPRLPGRVFRGASRTTFRAAAGFALLALLLVSVPIAAQEADTSKPAKQETAAAKERVVNINTADAAQLALLPRVGPALSQRILDFRQENGKFEAPEELILVRGIGEKTFELLEPYVVVKGETTLTQKVRGMTGASGSSGGEAR